MIKKNPTGPTYRATDLAAKYKDIGIPAVAAAAGQSRSEGKSTEAQEKSQRRQTKPRSGNDEGRNG